MRIESEENIETNWVKLIMQWDRIIFLSVIDINILNVYQNDYEKKYKPKQ